MRQPTRTDIRGVSNAESTAPVRSFETILSQVLCDIRWQNDKCQFTFRGPCMYSRINLFDYSLNLYGATQPMQSEPGLWGFIFIRRLIIMSLSHTVWSLESTNPLIFESSYGNWDVWHYSFQTSFPICTSINRKRTACHKNSFRVASWTSISNKTRLPKHEACLTCRKTGDHFVVCSFFSLPIAFRGSSDFA